MENSENSKYSLGDHHHHGTERKNIMSLRIARGSGNKRVWEDPPWSTKICEGKDQDGRKKLCTKNQLEQKQTKYCVRGRPSVDVSIPVGLAFALTRVT